MAIEEKLIKIELSIPDDKDLLHELEVMLREGELFLSPSNKPLTDLDLMQGNVLGRCVNIDLKCLVHDDMVLILTVKPIYIEKQNLWLLMLNAGATFAYEICCDKDDIISHIQIVKGDD